MTDLTPNDLSHLSDDEFNALCPQGEHAPGFESLSPAAQAVWDAYNDFDHSGMHVRYRIKLAAALRAAVKQTMPVVKSPWSTSLNPVLTAMESRDRLLAIADELESAQ